MPGRQGLLLPLVVNKILPGIIWIIIIHQRDFQKRFANFMRTRSPSLTFSKKILRTEISSDIYLTPHGINLKKIYLSTSKNAN